MIKIFWKAIYGITALTGIISAIWGNETFLLTFINPIWLVLICSISTLATFAIIRNHYFDLYKTNKSYLPLAQSFCSTGLLVTSLFLITNYQLASTNLNSEIFNILKVDELGGTNHKPFVIIKKGEFTKQLVFKRNPTINPTNRIQLKTAEGFFAFEVIIEQEIID
jgi:hypothetical protein